MLKRDLRRRRTLLLEKLEVRRNMTMFVPGIYQSGAVDDTEVVRVGSTENAIRPLENDLFWEYISVREDRYSPRNNSVAIDSMPPLSARPFVPESGGTPLGDLKLVSVTDPKHGMVRISEDRQRVFYTPNPGFEGVDQFEYVVQTVGEGAKTAKISINVVEPLLAVDDWFLSKPGPNSLDLTVLENDRFNASRFNDDTARTRFKIVEITSPIAGGSACISADRRSIVYASASNFEGLETLSYTIEDGDGYRATAKVTIRVSQSTTADQTLWPEQLRQQWLDQSISTSVYRFGIEVGPRFSLDYTPAINDSMASRTTLIQNATLDASETQNNQIAGVDEGDIVETDGRYLYLFSRNTNHLPTLFRPIGGLFAGGIHSDATESSDLIIVDTNDPKLPKVVSQIRIEGRLVSQFLHGDRLAVLTEAYVHDGMKTTIAIYDIENRTQPKLVRSTLIDGSLKESRMIGDKLYVFADSYVRMPEPQPFAVENGDSLFYETGRQFLARLGEHLYNESLVQVKNYNAQGELVGEPISALSLEQATMLMRESGVAFGIYSFDIDAVENGPFDIDTLAARYASTIFVSTQGVYLFETNWAEASVVGEATRITFFGFNNVDGKVEREAEGDVAGSLVNRFSVGEHNGDLQVFSNAREVGARLSVLRRDGNLLKEIGGIHGIAPGEQIYAARLDGDRAFLVTFRQVDPLFLFDLSNPTAPKIVSELKLPGYSQYLHLIDSTHLLGIGRTADEQSGLFGSLQLNLFDVSDPNGLKVSSHYEFEGGRQTFSPLLGGAFGIADPLALGYFAGQRILALPLNHVSDWFGTPGERTSSETRDLPEVGVLRIDPSSGITYLGGVQSSALVNRTMLIGGYLYSIATDRIIVTDLLTPSVRHAEVVLPPPLPQPTIDKSGSTGVTGGNKDGVTNRGTGERSWHNRERPCDVNGDGTVAAIDVLNVINFLRSRGSGAIASLEAATTARATADASASEAFYQVDVNGDGQVSPIDVLLVINQLRRESGTAGEGEARAVDAVMASGLPSLEELDRKRPR